MNSNPITEEEAKKLAAGPLGKEFSKFPLLFAKAVFFGQRPSPKTATKIKNGTITLIDFGKGPIGLTCQHVIKGYREYKENYEDVLFNIGHVELDPIDQLIDENDQIDLATIELTEQQVKAITSHCEIGSCVYNPSNWPPTPVKKGEFVAFGGFPGSLQTVKSFNELVFSSWSSGGSLVHSVSEYRFVSPFEREHWIKSFGEPHQMDLHELGGMSGSPTFVFRGVAFEFVGVLYEYEDNFDTVIFTSAHPVKPDGTITSPII